MITKFEKYNEGIKHLLVGPTKEEVWDNYINGDLKGLIKSIPTSPEDFINQIFEGCIIKGEDRSGYIYGKNGFSIFLDDFINRYIRFSYRYIWSVLCNVYGLSDSEIKEILTNLLKNTEWCDNDIAPSFYIDNIYN